jgi:hypothetical protein
LGAMRASSWLMNQQSGLYDMQDVLGLWLLLNIKLADLFLIAIESTGLLIEKYVDINLGMKNKCGCN